MGLGFAAVLEDSDSVPLVVPVGELSIRQRAFLTAFADCHTIRGAVKRSKIHHIYHYEWLAEDASYQAVYARIQAMISGLTVETIEQRAVKGYKKPLSYQGKLTGDAIVEYDSSLQVQYLKAHDPKYRDSNVTVNVGPQSLAITYPGGNDLGKQGDSAPTPNKITHNSHNSPSK